MAEVIITKNRVYNVAACTCSDGLNKYTIWNNMKFTSEKGCGNDDDDDDALLL